MRYELRFCVPADKSGYATYIGKKLNTSCYRYQFERPNNYRAQQFIFYDINILNNFLKTMIAEFGDEFILESLENISYKDELEGGSQK